MIERLAPQCDGLILNANGDPGRFAITGLPVVAGRGAGLRRAACRDSRRARLGRRATAGPALGRSASPPTALSCRRDLVERLHAARRLAGVPLACAASGGQAHPVVGLWPVAAARRPAPGARRRGHAQDRPLDGALSAWRTRHGRSSPSTPSSTPTRRRISRRPRRLRRWRGDS